MPPYGPDLNQIEQAFSKLKALRRKAAARSADALWHAVGELLARFNSDDCFDYFANAGYVFAKWGPL